MNSIDTRARNFCVAKNESQHANCHLESNYPTTISRFPKTTVESPSTNDDIEKHLLSFTQDFIDGLKNGTTFFVENEEEDSRKSPANTPQRQ